MARGLCLTHLVTSQIEDRRGRACSAGIPASQLPDLEGLVTDVACPSLHAAELAFNNHRKRPACLVHGFIVATMRPTRRPLAEWPCRAKGQSASAGSNASPSCRAARARFAGVLNSTDHSRARCWEFSQKRGLVLLGNTEFDAQSSATVKPSSFPAHSSPSL